MPKDKQGRPDNNQLNIDSVTAELGRNTGDIGETRRLEVLTTLMKKRQSHIASHGAKASRKIVLNHGCRI
jgi:hypothetical protein